MFESTDIVGSENIAAHKGTTVDRNGVLGGCTGPYVHALALPRAVHQRTPWPIAGVALLSRERCS